MKTQHDLFLAITSGAVQRVRPKLMTVATTVLALLPALFATGAGAEAIQRIAAPMVGGLITSTILTLEIVPAIYPLWRGRQVEWIKGPRPPKKSWNELSAEFLAMESQTTTVGEGTSSPALRQQACNDEQQRDHNHSQHRPENPSRLAAQASAIGPAALLQRLSGTQRGLALL